MAEKMKSYPVEFRQKILDCYYNEPISQRQLAKRFCVTLSFVQKLLKQFRETGDIRPKTYRCGRHLKLTPEQMSVFGQLIEENNDATLAELSELFLEKTGILLSVATVARTAERLRMTRQKNSRPDRKRDRKNTNITRPHYPDNSNYGTENKGDDSGW
ncbi:MAG: transposase [Microcystis novacekii Mn_MB_F_20050700_S1]|jgi:transposase|nr:MAG: transposase [Microcystis novacekii Mn_MB_F_20050700_S1]